MVDREALVNQANEMLAGRNNSLPYVLAAIGLCLVALTDMAVQDRKEYDEDEDEDDK